ncbi:four-carbon acid sugar kinase family protein [Mariniluteicoccus flavus]
MTGDASVNPDPSRLMAARVAAGRRTVALDDDPTGSQAVHDVAVVTVLEPDAYAAALAEPGSTAFLLTNTRSLDQADAVALTDRVARDLFALQRDRGWRLDVVSRSDSTLRGHVLAEVAALDRARESALGKGFDGILFVPAYLEAGRFTSGDVHYAMVDGSPVPAGETEFARDATFGYAASNLADFLVAKGVPADRVTTLGLETIRAGIDAVRAVLDEVGDGRWVVVNAETYADLDTVAAAAIATGKDFLSRSGPSWVRALSGIEGADPLSRNEIWPSGVPGTGHGLAVVGSHVGQTARQVERARERGGVREVVIDVPTLVEGDDEAHVAEVVAEVREALATGDVLVYTSRRLVRGTDADDSLRIARLVSDAVVEVVRGALEARPAWVIGKGGITSHDVAVRGLGIRRATVLGQLFPGMVSVLRPDDAPAGVVGTPYVVFAGNVGDEHALADAIELFREDSSTREARAGRGRPRPSRSARSENVDNKEIS